MSETVSTQNQAIYLHTFDEDQHVIQGEQAYIQQVTVIAT